MLILLSGQIGSGKTTLCARAASAARARGMAVAGVLAPAIMEGDAKMGIEAEDLGTGERRLLARVDRDLGGVHVGRYALDDATLVWVLDLDRAALESDALVFVDEIGRLELNKGGGLAPLIPLLAQPRRASTVVIVRDTLLEKLLARLGPAPVRVVPLDPNCREVAWRKLKTLLFGTDGERGRC